MKYVSISGFERYVGASVDSIETSIGESIELKLYECEERMIAYIIPRIPETDEEKTAFCNAVYSQFVYENKPSTGGMEEMPEGVKSFTIGRFTMSLYNSYAGTLTKKSVSPSAHAILLNAGLMYKGLR